MRKPASLRPGASNKTAPLLATVLALALATQFGACGGGSSPAGPTPAPLSAGISASLSPSSPTVRRMNTGDPTRSLFELRGAVTFKDDAGTGLQLSALEIDVVDVAGNVERQSAVIDVTIPAGGSATHPCLTGSRWRRAASRCACVSGRPGAIGRAGRASRAP